MYFSASVNRAVSFLLLCLSLPLTIFSLPLTALSTSQLYNFGIGVWVENILVRPSGSILVTLIAPGPQVWQIDPSTGSAYHVATFPNAESCLGIAPGADLNTVYVIASNYSASTAEPSTPTAAIWELDLSDFDPPSCNDNSVHQRLAAYLPSALNGLTALPTEGDKPPLLLAASLGGPGPGEIWRIDPATGASSIAIEDPLTNYNQSAPPPPIGVNGVRLHGEELYFTNSAQGLLARAPIDTHTGGTTGPPEVLVQGLVFPDDFVVNEVGDAFVAVPEEGIVGVVKAGQNRLTKLADAPGPTACGLSEDGKSLYVTTSGGDAMYSNGSETVPGGVLRVDLSTRLDY